MPQASLQAFSILGDGVLAGALKKGASAKGLDALLGGNAKTGNSELFGKLLSGIHKAKNADAVSAILTDAPVEIKGVDIVLGPILEMLPAELAAVLKKLNIVALKNVPPQIAAMFTPAQTGTAAPDDSASAFLDALGKIADGEPIPADLFKLVDDPKLAALLAGLNALVAQTRDESVSVDADGMITILFTDGVEDRPAPAALPAGITTSVVFEAAQKEIDYLKENTITIADLDGDAFQNLKKLMFADIAPYLTKPRTVRVGDGTVMKVAQGPSFLTDENTDATMLAAMAGLVPALPAHAVAPVVEGASPDLGIPTPQETIVLPAFLNPEILAQAQGQTQDSQKPGVRHANLFAALFAAGQPQTSTPGADASVPAPVPGTPAALLAGAGKNAGAQLPGMVPHTGVHAPAAAVPASTAATRGFETAMTGLDHVMAPADGMIEGLEGLLRLHADQSQPANASTNLLSAKSASQLHPSTHLVSVSLQRAIQGAMPLTPGAERQLTIQMEPGTLGRVKVTLQFGEDNSVKAKILAEKPETIALLQKDAGVLERALNNAGLDASRSDMSFDLAGGDTFSGSLRDEGGNANHHSKTKNDDGTEFATIENVMSIFVDPETGLTHVNVVI